MKSEPIVREGDRAFIRYDAIEIGPAEKDPRHTVVFFKYRDRVVFELPTHMSISNGWTLCLTELEGKALITLDDSTNPQSAEQKARDLLERTGVFDAQNYSAGELVELANLISEVESLREKVR